MRNKNDGRENIFSTFVFFQQFKLVVQLKILKLTYLPTKVPNKKFHVIDNKLVFFLQILKLLEPPTKVPSKKFHVIDINR